MKIILNGKELESDSSLERLLQTQLLSEKKGIAVAVNNAVVPKTLWKSYSLKENDKILIIQASQGG